MSKDKSKKRKAKFLEIVKGTADGRQDILTSGGLMIRDTVLVVVGGGVLSAICGKWTLPIGAGLTLVGHYYGSPSLRLVGVGTMAGQTFAALSQKSLKGVETDGIDGIKDRMDALKSELAKKFFVEKFLRKSLTSSNPPAAEIGEVQFFSPDEAVYGDLSALDDIERQLSESALQFQGNDMIEVGDTPDMQTGDVPSEVVGDIGESIGELIELQGSEFGDFDDKNF